MDKIIWDNSFSVGVPTLDKQHQKIISIINQLIADPTSDFGSVSVAKILNELTHFASEHFITEEDLLAKFDYPDLPSQRKEHKAFRTRLAGYCMEAMHSNSAIPLHILAFLKGWWVDHILVKDMDYRPFLASRDVK
ncbi:MAG: methyl-accepting chemotaxis sensory transducer [Holophagaceae bacterium]|nr:methyl-accepting chemotaxis sensory transducer [Holophagaceae bacterium]